MKETEKVYNREIRNIKNKYRFLKVHPRYRLLKDQDLYSDSDFYSGPIIDFQPHMDDNLVAGPNAFLKHQEELSLKYLTDDSFSHPRLGKQALNLHAASIKTDPRAALYLKLFQYPDEVLYNVKMSDLVDVNVGINQKEVTTNCLRLSINKVFGINYDDVIKKMPEVGEQLPPELKYELSNKRVINYLKGVGKNVKIVGSTPTKKKNVKVGVPITDAQTAKEQIKNITKSNNLRELHWVIVVYRHDVVQNEVLEAHAMTLRSVLKKK